MRRIEAHEYRRMPWKNGGGETAQIAIGPAGATVEDFDWRISAARMTLAGPFSAFAGIDRSLAVLQGRGLKLRVSTPEGERELVLGAHGEAQAFDGEWPVQAELIGGEPVLDFNVMTRRSRYTHCLRRLQLDTPAELTADVLVLYCVEGVAECHAAADPAAPPLALRPGEALVAQAPAALRLAPTGGQPARLWLAQLFAVESGHG